MSMLGELAALDTAAEEVAVLAKRAYDEGRRSSGDEALEVLFRLKSTASRLRAAVSDRDRKRADEHLARIMLHHEAARDAQARAFGLTAERNPDWADALSGLPVGSPVRTIVARALRMTGSPSRALCWLDRKYLGETAEARRRTDEARKAARKAERRLRAMVPPPKGKPCPSVPVGKRGTVIYQDGRAFQARYMLRELDAFHLTWEDGDEPELRPYPALVLTRHPEVDAGPPVVDVAGKLVAGEATVRGMVLASEAGEYEPFATALRESAPSFGIPLQEVERYDKPVLVREVSYADAALIEERTRGGAAAAFVPHTGDEDSRALYDQAEAERKKLDHENAVLRDALAGVAEAEAEDIDREALVEQAQRALQVADMDEEARNRFLAEEAEKELRAAQELKRREAILEAARRKEAEAERQTRAAIRGGAVLATPTPAGTVASQFPSLIGFGEFERVYREELRKAAERHPDQYMFTPADSDRVATKMLISAGRDASHGHLNSISVDGHAWKGAARRLGIKGTRRDILNYLRRGPVRVYTPGIKVVPSKMHRGKYQIIHGETGKRLGDRFDALTIDQAEDLANRLGNCKDVQWDVDEKEITSAHLGCSNAALNGEIPPLTWDAVSRMHLARQASIARPAAAAPAAPLPPAPATPAPAPLADAEKDAILMRMMTEAIQEVVAGMSPAKAAE